MLGPRYKSVNFGAEKSPVSPKWYIWTNYTETELGFWAAVRQCNSREKRISMPLSVEEFTRGRGSMSWRRTARGGVASR